MDIKYVVHLFTKAINIGLNFLLKNSLGPKKILSLLVGCLRPRMYCVNVIMSSYCDRSTPYLIVHNIKYQSLGINLTINDKVYR